MRNILFRGKRIDTGEWVYGYPYIGIGETYISYIIPEWLYNGYEDQKQKEWTLRFEQYYQVDPKTITEYTGLKDNNGVEVYDGDKVKRRVYLIEGSDYMHYTCEVRWNGWCYALFIHDKQVWGLDPITAKEIEVIGNIYQ